MLEMMVERSLFEPKLECWLKRERSKLSKKYLESNSPRLELSNYVRSTAAPIIHSNHTPNVSYPILH